MTPDSVQLPFSICINAYNARRWLPATLESIRAQSHANWELIVVEDGSPEPSRDLVEAFAKTVTQRVNYHTLPANVGCARSREKALDLARHPHLALMDSDDLWEPMHLAVLAREFADGDPDFVFCGFKMFADNIHEPGPVFAPAADLLGNLREAYFHCKLWLQPSAVAFHRRIFERTGPWSQGLELKPASLPGNRDMSEDRHFFMRAFQAGIEPRWSGQTTVHYRQHAASMRGSESWAIVHRAWIYNQLGLFKGFSRPDQRRFNAHINLQAARALAAVPAHGRLAARTFFRAWCWWPWRIDRLVPAVMAWLRVRLADEPQ